MRVVENGHDRHLSQELFLAREHNALVAALLQCVGRVAPLRLEDQSAAALAHQLAHTVRRLVHHHVGRQLALMRKVQHPVKQPVPPHQLQQPRDRLSWEAAARQEAHSTVLHCGVTVCCDDGDELSQVDRVHEDLVAGRVFGEEELAVEGLECLEELLDVLLSLLALPRLHGAPADERCIPDGDGMVGPLEQHLKVAVDVTDDGHHFFAALVLERQENASVLDYIDEPGRELCVGALRGSGDVVSLLETRNCPLVETELGLDSGVAVADVLVEDWVHGVLHALEEEVELVLVVEDLLEEGAVGMDQL
mmetsp:Transcript_12041/g.48504  ORF Transcript_12041/g.48504 Transcript_12041/m.48504 type:complete len:307 (+) Transcript_12041:1617-2537(+)